MKIRLKKQYTILLYFIPIIFLIGLLYAEIKYSIKSVNVDSVAYKEKGDISYKVHLKPNDLGYDSEYLDENSSYIASLIDSFIVNYNYISTFSSNVKYEVKYDIKADLTVYDSDNKTKPIFTKNYTLMPEEIVSGTGKVASVTIADKVINYDEYNAIIQTLKQEVIPSATLSVKFNTRLNAKSDVVKENIISNYTSSLDIPISQKTINVDLTKNNLSDSKTVTSKKKLDKRVIALLAITILILLIIIIKFMMYLIKISKKKSKYEQRIKKILREFDRAITEAKGKPNIERDANMIAVKEIEELLDVHDNLNVPIIYYRLNSYASLFIVRHNSDIYYCVIKSSDFE